MPHEGAVDITEFATQQMQFPRHLVELGFRLMERTHETDGEHERYILPPLCPVPAGAFLMGSDPQRDPAGRAVDQPQHTVTVGAYAIGTYPLTVAEYICFVQATAHPPRGWWRSRMRHLDHPVTHITYQEARAYAAWLGQVSGQPWRLPTEAEWEKAARGVDGRLYSWGDAREVQRANTLEHGPRKTTPVDAYADGASLYGCIDLIGNVWEWTSSARHPYPYDARDGREDPHTASKVLRGGSWQSYLATSTFRFVGRSNGYARDEGARLVCGTEAA